MRHPSLSSAQQRLQAAKVTGATERYSIGADLEVPAEAAAAGLQAITRDPVVLGHVLGAYLVKAETMAAYGRGVEILRAAGAGEAAAAAKASWLRSRQDQFGYGAG